MSYLELLGNLFLGHVLGVDAEFSEVVLGHLAEVDLCFSVTQLHCAVLVELEVVTVVELFAVFRELHVFAKLLLKCESKLDLIRNNGKKYTEAFALLGARRHRSQG